MVFVASAWAIIEIRSNLGGCGRAPSTAPAMVSAMSVSSAMRSASLFTTASGASMLAMATSDQWVSLRRSCHGKSNRVASIMAVSSVETRSTQSNGSVARQAVEHGLGALPDRRLHVGEVGRRHDRRHRLALRGVARRVHADEVGQFLALGLVGDLDAAQLRRRRIGAGVELDLHDVGVARHRPVGSVGAVLRDDGPGRGAAAAQNARARNLRDRGADR